MQFVHEEPPGNAKEVTHNPWCKDCDVKLRASIAELLNKVSVDEKKMREKAAEEAVEEAVE